MKALRECGAFFNAAFAEARKPVQISNSQALSLRGNCVRRRAAVHSFAFLQEVERREAPGRLRDALDGVSEPRRNAGEAFRFSKRAGEAAPPGAPPRRRVPAAEVCVREYIPRSKKVKMH